MDLIPHDELKERTYQVKTIIRNGDIIAWGDVMLVSGTGGRWQMEKKMEDAQCETGCYDPSGED